MCIGIYVGFVTCACALRYKISASFDYIEVLHVFYFFSADVILQTASNMAVKILPYYENKHGCIKSVFSK